MLRLSKVSFELFTAPARGQISHDLTNECYTHVKFQVDRLVHSQHSLNFVVMYKDMKDVIFTGRAHAVWFMRTS